MSLRRATGADGTPSICGAKTRQQTPCQGQPMPNGRCRMHGGRSNVGIAVATFRHGRYSKYLPSHLLVQYQHALTDPERLVLEDELALTDATIQALLPRFAEPAVREEIGAAIERRRKLVESERKRLIALGQYLTREQALAYTSALIQAVKRYVTDPETLRSVVAEFARLTGPAHPAGTAPAGRLPTGAPGA